MSTCSGCGGTIEDGYCMVCGLAAAPALAPAMVSASAGRRGRTGEFGACGSAVAAA